MIERVGPACALNRTAADFYLSRLVDAPELSHMPLDLLPAFIRENHEVHEWRHASSILKHDFPAEFGDICEILAGFRVRHSHIITGGGRKSKVAEAIDSEFTARGWVEKQFDTAVTVDGHETKSPTHKSKLLPRIQGGSGGGCPILVFGISRKLYAENL